MVDAARRESSRWEAGLRLYKGAYLGSSVSLLAEKRRERPEREELSNSSTC